MKRLWSLLLLPLILLASGSPGIRPRAGVNDYPSHAAGADAETGAAIIPSTEAKKIFAADLSQYIVVEVGIFPLPGKDADVAPHDFTLLTDPDSVSQRPADSDSVAAVVLPDKSAASQRTSDVYSTAGVSVGHESYPDPVTGGRTGITRVGTEAGVGIGNSGVPQYPAPGSGAQHARLEQKLWEDSLPDGKTPRPVAGYLYFPKPSRKTKNAAWVLRWDGPAGRVNIPVR